MRDLTQKQLDQLTFLKAFNSNFNNIILKYNTKDKKIYVFKGEPKENFSNYINFGKIEFINGWLYGAVQSKYHL